MPRGRPRLDPKVKLEHLKQSRQDYEDKNVDLRRRKARERMQRTRARVAQDPIAHSKAKQKAAEHSDNYRYRPLFKAQPQMGYRKSEAERAAHKRASRVQKKARQQDKERVYNEHLPARLERERRNPRAAASPPSPRYPAIERTISALAASDSEEDNDENVLPTLDGVSRWPVHSPRCRHCFGDGCIGCACLCEVSNEWIEHEGGHYFPTCEHCGGSDCPACACICPKSTVWVDHGGHLSALNSKKLSRAKIPLFRSP
ncbi:hypothetical protein FB45DRAFT_873538 [Roridomyces roridus]|uniref:Uncharacterized protein n=1 Tax=Roridomyces roridus TaxID=1738132 RepID=A0AAD7BB44_9AGAR|nr:hypothetical protein FB45DRAFT_873538 [Roridomyces roridus]